MNDGLLSHGMTITAEHQPFSVYGFAMRPAEADGADRFARYGTGGTCNAGGGQCDIGVGVDERALGHFSSNFFADCPKLRDQRLGHTEALCL